MQTDPFQALADPTRRRIVELLRGGELQVNDLVEAVDVHQSGVSRHLRILLEAGFVKMRPDGQRRLYALDPRPFRELSAWLQAFEETWNERLDRFGFGAALGKRKHQRDRDKGR